MSATGEPAPDVTAPEPTDDGSAQLVRWLLEAEALDELLSRLCQAGRIGHFDPAGDGRVAMVGAAAGLIQGDMLFGTARDLPAALPVGVPLKAMLAQAFSAGPDPALGRGLPGAVTHASHGVSLTDGNVASHLMHAAGFGHAARLKGGDRVALAIFGGAAQANGELHGALNFAALYKAQTVFVARGELADEVPFEEAAEAWGVTAVTVKGDDAAAVRDAVVAARARAIAGGGPTVVDARLVGPVKPWDIDRLRRSGRWERDDRMAALQAVRTAVVRARAAAEMADGVGVDTLPEGVFSDSPWFLNELEPKS